MGKEFVTLDRLAPHDPLRCDQCGMQAYFAICAGDAKALVLCWAHTQQLRKKLRERLGNYEPQVFKTGGKRAKRKLRLVRSQTSFPW